MAGRSYLRRIAQPLAPGDPALAPLRAPRAEEARPPAMPPALPSVTQRRPAPNAAPAPEPALAREPSAATPAMSQPDPDRAAPEMPSAAPAGAASAPAATAAASAAPSTQDRSSPRTQPSSTVEAPRERVVGATPTSPRTSIHIGTIEVRTPPAAIPAPSPPQARSRRPPSAAPSTPLARSLTWRYGLLQS
jgi:hypothetical protein